MMHYNDIDINSMYKNNLCYEIALTKPSQVVLEGLTFNFHYYLWKTPKKVKHYQFSRAKWYVADFDWSNELEVMEWCREQFGPHPENPDAWSRWAYNYDEKIHFRDEKDYAWFMLRWS